MVIDWHNTYLLMVKLKPILKKIPIRTTTIGDGKWNFKHFNQFHLPHIEHRCNDTGGLINDNCSKSLIANNRRGYANNQLDIVHGGYLQGYLPKWHGVVVFPRPETVTRQLGGSLLPGGFIQVLNKQNTSTEPIDWIRLRWETNENKEQEKHLGLARLAVPNQQRSSMNRFWWLLQ